MVQFIEKQYKSILNKLKYIDSWFWARYTINPYNGCQFGCIYCDSRSEQYHMPSDFENKIVIKQAVGPMLDARLRRARTLLPDVVGMGGVTDAYQPAEKKYENTRRLLEVLHDYNYPVHIITKSPLVLRDLDLLDEIAGNSWAAVSFTVTTMEPEMATFVDYRSPTPAKRIEALRQIKQTAPRIHAGALLIPLIPVLCDSESSMRAVLAAASDAGADYLLFGGAMTLRNRQGAWFLEKLQAHNPDAYAQYRDLYSFTTHEPTYTGRYTPRSAYMKEKHKLLLQLCPEYDLPYRIPRWIPEDWRRTNYRIAELMLNRAYEHQIRGRAWKNLFWAGQNIQNLKEPLEAVAARGELETIRNVRGKIKWRVEELIKG